MKLLVIGDLHGKRDKLYDGNELRYDFSSYDKIIFIGDYWDSFDVPFADQKSLFLDVIKLKKKYGDKVKLLMGNHDAQYLYISNYSLRCSGYQEEYQREIHFLMDREKDLFEYFSLIEVEGIEYLFSHAGVCGSFEREMLDKYGLTYKDYELFKVGDEVREIFNISEACGGYKKYDGPLWLRPESLEQDIPSFGAEVVQVFGHTFNEEMVINIDRNNNYINVDCLENLIISKHN